MCRPYRRTFLTQAKHFMSTLLRGDPQEGSVIVGAAKELLSSILPRP